ncbi:TRAP-type C4-dicarboxylate transport system permease small subunit [Humitalea rosea]|uniref:TRAP transporter small permease protein n=1 Tax=Humitalea rosea TaxID=990373 RepID=A0A2W7II50_9PROT|nr:TRAP transporter small permease [Humitalea rosea]PZW38987.1 TRAP-type C4-dicarboxylate transport system permease small subunit [Humitalea rosea]
MPPSGAREFLRRFNTLYSRVLDVLLILTVAVLLLPVTMQIFARFTELLPRYIWTEELSRFLLIWMIMIGAMIGVREGTHFTVDLFPSLKGRTRAALDIFSGIFVLIFAMVFLVYGWEFTDLAWYRISELAELPLPMIHLAWPVAGATWLLFQGERMWDDLRVLRHGDEEQV